MKTKWYNNGLIEKLIKENDEIPNGFSRGRLHKKTKTDELSEKFSKEYIYELYIIQNMPYDKLFTYLNISRSDLRKLLSRYKIKKDIKYARKNNTYRRSPEEIRLVAEKSKKTQQERWRQKDEDFKKAYSEKRSREMLSRSSEAKEQTRKKYQAYWNNLSQEEKEEINRKKSISSKKVWKNKNEELLKKRHDTYIKNREVQKQKLCRTIAEQKLYDILIKKYSDVVYDIRVDDRYPFYCDFYIPSLDLFIELQAHPSHGRLPYSMLTFEEYSKYPNKWVDVFARRDVEKLKYIENNDLNFIRLYPNATLQENYTINKNKNIEIINICYRSQH